MPRCRAKIWRRWESNPRSVPTDWSRRIAAWLIPTPAPAKPDDAHVYVLGSRWRPDRWDGREIRGMGALHAAREEDRLWRRERRVAWREAWRQRGWAQVRSHDGTTTYRTLIADGYHPHWRNWPALWCALLLAPFARRGCRHDYRTDHFSVATWDFSPYHDDFGGSWTELLVPLPYGRPEIVRDGS